VNANVSLYTHIERERFRTVVVAPAHSVQHKSTRERGLVRLSAHALGPVPPAGIVREGVPPPAGIVRPRKLCQALSRLRIDLEFARAQETVRLTVGVRMSP